MVELIRGAGLKKENDVKYHEAAEIFPMMDKVEYESLKDDIKTNGLREPITVFENKILDGRNRFRACKELGLNAKTQELPKGVSPLTYVISLNLKRRHLTASQKSAVATDILPMLEKEALQRKATSRKGVYGGKPLSADLREAVGKSSAQAANMVGVGSRMVELAKSIKVASPKLFEEIRSGNITLNDASRQIRADKRQAAREALVIPDNIRVDITHGDFRKLINKVPKNSIDLVLTDPPYPKQYLPLWLSLAKESLRVLKPGGFMIAYSGNAFVPQVFDLLRKHLNYYWLGMLYHKGPTAQRFEVNMWNRSKPILFFYKPPLKKQKEWLEDVLVSEGRDKDNHEWGQSVGPFKKLIECFTDPGMTICDPFFGGGTTIQAAIETKRNFVGFEIDKNHYQKARKIWK